jgi:hypothetical protein
MDASLIREPLRAALWVGLPARTVALSAGKRTCQGGKKKKRLGMVVPYLVYVICVELHHAICLLQFLHRKDGGPILLSKS